MKDSSSTNSELIEEISALKQRIQDLEQSESELRKVSSTFGEYARQSDSVFNAINNSVCVIDPDGRIIKCNRSTEKLFNKSTDELNGHFCFEVVHGESKPIPGCPFLRMKETKRRESMVIQSHGRWLEVTVDPILDDNQRIIAAVHIIVDITERKRAQEELEKHRYHLEELVEQRTAECERSDGQLKGQMAERKKAQDQALIFRYFAEASGQGFGMATLDGDITYVNPTLCRFLGEEKPEDVCHKKNFAIYYPQEMRDRLKKEVIPAVIGTGQWIGELALISIHGKYTPTIENFILIRDEDGNPLCLADVVTDITERKAIEAESMTDRKRAEKALKESEAKYRALFENAVEGIFQTTPEGRFISANPAQAKLFGYNSPQELMEQITDIGGQHYANPRDREIYTNTIESKGIIKGFEVQLLKKDGNPIWVSLNAHAVRNEEGGSIYYEGTAEDINERKQAEEALKEGEAKYRSIFQNAVMGIFRTTPDGHYLSINPAGAKMYHYASEEDMRQSVTDMAHQIYVYPEDRKRLQELLEINGFVEAFESPHYTKEGNIIWVSINIRVIRDNSGAILYYETTSQDITSRKHAEEEITREREKLKTLSDNAPFGMVLIDKEGHFAYINRKFTELFGYDLSDIPDGRTWCGKAYPDAGYRHTVISAWKADLGDPRPGEKNPNIFTVTCKDGTEKIVQFIFSVLVSGDSLMTCEDITELKHIESQLRQAHKMESIGTLAGGIAHDFNNILTALMGYASLIQIKMDRSDPLRAYVDEVLSASEKAVDLTQSLLAFSRQQPVTLVSLDMNNTIKAAEKLLRRLLTEDIEFRTSLHGDDMIIMADKSQMDQILFNLVTNARDAMPKGGALTIKTSLATIDASFIKVHGFGEAGKYVRISITDTGMGMDETTRQKIFDPFFTTKEAGKGTGLGLATVYGIVKTHNGYIIVDSIPKEGTAFHIYLPQATVKINTTEDMTTPMKRGKETILIAEDNEGVRRFMREALQGYGYTIREATDGEDAIEKFKEQRDIDLIIIDSVMPRKNGREAYEEIRSIDPHIKALFTSGYTKDVVLDKGIEEKEFDFIAKPLSLDKLLQKVREVLDRE